MEKSLPPVMSKAQKNRAKRKKKDKVIKEETLELKNSNPLVKSVSVSDEKTKVTPEMKKEYQETALREGQKLWEAVKKRSKDPEFVALDDKKKIDEFKEFHAFHKEFPIVSRYIICMGQYSSRAFKRYLIKVQNFKYPEVREKGYMEDQWVRRQADYIRYLWEAYQRGHYNNAEAQSIWQEAYKTLKQEFLDFRDMHENIEKNLEIEKEKHKQELITELMNRLSSGEQSLDSKKMNELIEVLRVQLLQQRKEKVNEQIKEKVTLVNPTREAFGTVKEMSLENSVVDFPPGVLGNQNQSSE